MSVGERLATKGKDALDLLKKGNIRFQSNTLVAKVDLAHRKKLLSGQHPIATIITCSDSRVVPNYIFDQGIGKLFVIRTAGEVLDDIVIASLEYGVEHLETPLLIVLGHTHCGAVEATVNDSKVHGHLPLILKNIDTAVDSISKSGKTTEQYMNEVILENTLQIAESLPNLSEIIKKAVENKKVNIVAALYDIISGDVNFMLTSHSKHYNSK